MCQITVFCENFSYFSNICFTQSALFYDVGIRSTRPLLDQQVFCEAAAKGTPGCKSTCKNEASEHGASHWCSLVNTSVLQTCLQMTLSSCAARYHILAPSIFLATVFPLMRMLHMEPRHLNTPVTREIEPKVCKGELFFPKTCTSAGKETSEYQAAHGPVCAAPLVY